MNLLACEAVFNLVLRGFSCGVAIILLSSCGVITKPVKLVTGVVVKPIKVVTKVGVGLLRKPVREAVRLVGPSSWPVQIRR